MGKLIRLTEIQKLAFVGRIPESAISAQILANVSKLDERKQLEPWIQELLFVSDETHHGPTEIVDLISTRLLVNGQSKYTGIILKGKATPKVSSRKIGHQILKLNQLQGLSLAILMAVGDIQDDAYRDFIQTALNIGCDYLIVNKLDVARILIASGQICPIDGLSYTQNVCPNGHQKNSGIELNYKVYEDVSFEIVRLRDVSHGAAKRLVAMVLTDRHYTPETLREIILKTIKKTKFDPYVRNAMVKARWGNTPAHVVWVDIAYELADISQSNWVCNACWIDPDLPSQFRPFRPLLSGIDEGNGLSISWNKSYYSRKKFLSDNTGLKYEIITTVEKLLTQIEPIADEIEQKYKFFMNDELSEPDFQEICKQYFDTVRTIYSRGTEIPLAPPDCTDYRQRFQDALAQFDNMFLCYTSETFLARQPRNRSWLFSRSLRNFRNTLQKLKYEREKLNE